MELNIILAGVGGQGILTIAQVLDQAAGQLGLHFKQAEVHGMAQRGGAVQSHLRIASGPVSSDLVPRGRADLILSVEPLEALRYLHYLSPAGAVVSSDNPHVNIPDYPAEPALFARFEQLARMVLVDARALARRAGSARAENVVMIGAAAPDLGLPVELLESLVVAMFARKGEKVVEANRSALRFGLAAGLTFRAARQAGLPLAPARRLTNLLDPEGLQAETRAHWVTLLAGPRGALVADLLATRQAPLAGQAAAALPAQLDAAPEAELAGLLAG